MHGLQTINRLNDQVTPVTTPKHSDAVRYTGHTPDGSGLQGHSVGDTYPAIVVAYGSGAFAVQLGTTIVPAKDHRQAQEYAEIIGSAHRAGGWNTAQRTAADLIAKSA